MAAPRDADVTVCVPAYKSAAMVGETLSALQAQTYDRLRIVVSVDASPDDTLEVCRSFTADPRIEVIGQPQRLGWIGNTNAVLAQVQTELFFICPHDDLPSPTYVERLRRTLLQRPEAIGAYCDVQAIDGDQIGAVTGLDAGPVERILALCEEKHGGVAWRSLNRSVVLQQGLRMLDNPYQGYNAHRTWLLELLGMGPMIRVGSPLYRRRVRFDQDSVIQSWKAWPDHVRSAAAVEHTAQCLGILAGMRLREEDRLTLQTACILKMLDLLPRSDRQSATPLATLLDLFARLTARLTSGAPAPAEQTLDPAAISRICLDWGRGSLKAGQPAVAAGLFAEAAVLDPARAGEAGKHLRSSLKRARREAAAGAPPD